MVSGAKRLIGSGIAYLLFGGFMLYLGLCAWGIIQSNDFPKGTFMAIVSTALGIFDIIIGTRRLFSWGGACPYCGYSKVSLLGDVTSGTCRMCKRKIVRKGSFFYQAE
jgi:hypothetical protein